MQAVGKLGSYISKSVVTVSGPFHPFGGAVDIVVVEQPDGSYKSSPWYVRFGKFQGVLKAKEKVVNISVNGVEADFHLYLDHKGEAYFLREVDVEEGTSSFSPPSSSGEDTDRQSVNRWPIKSKSCNYDADSSGSILNGRNRNAMGRTNSRRSQILGLVFGRKSVKDCGIQEEIEGSGVVQINSLERAEIAADLLELKWSTNIASARRSKDNASRFSAQHKSKDEVNKNFLDDDSLYNEIGIISHSSYQKLENDVEENDRENSCLTSVYDSETSTSIENVKEDSHKSNSETSTMTEILDLVKADYQENSATVKSEITSPDSQISNSVERHNGSSDIIFAEENGTDRIQSFCCNETCESSEVGLDGAAQGSNGIFSCEACGGVCLNAKTIHATTELTSTVNSGQETNVLFGKEPLNIQECLGNEDHFSFFLDEKNSEAEGTSLNSSSESIATKSHNQVVSLNPSNDFIEEVEPLSGLIISRFSNSACPHKEKRTVWREDETNKYGSCSRLQGYPQISTSGAIITMSDISVEEQLLFGDLDDSSFSKAKDIDTIYPNHEKEIYPLSPMVSNGVNESSTSECSATLYPDESVTDDTAEESRSKLRTISSNVSITSNTAVHSKEHERMVRSLPNMLPFSNDLDACDLDHSLHQSSSSCSDIKSGKNKNLRLPRAQSIAKDIKVLEELKEGPANPPLGNASRSTDSLSRSRGRWSFSFKRSRSVPVSQPTKNGIESYNVKNILTTDDMVGEKDVPNLKVNKKKIKTLTPTSEQLASLNLKEGRNIVVFTFSTAMLGKQQVDARVYLWRWDTKIVISDVDGTITRSDLLGQVMPWVGMDWSQIGVAHLFSAIKENGYQLLFLSARSISQAYHTRQFLFNLKQNGKALPDGPVVISPDGLFPSLYREVVRRAPHEFKIACLEDIRALFPSDRNPFYAGFGNRDTDEVSYLKVGIPSGKIFMINPKGEIVVNRRTHTRSYTSLFDLVHGMFPSMSSSEQEDFNQWNYWKLPLPLIDI